MKYYTLRELCEKAGVTRRAVQWFEKNGLVSPCGRTDRCYLLYNESALKKVKEIKSLQNYGFSVSEIKKYLESNTREQKETLIQKYEELNEKCSKVISYLKEIENLIKIKNKQ